MATESILKDFIVDDEETLKRLVDILSQEKTIKEMPTSSKYEEGKQLLARLFPR